MLPQIPDKSQLTYTPNYCEENVYFLCKSFSSAVETFDTFACFISNEHKSVPLWKQRIAEGPDVPVIW
ncbi:588_t:CDS:2, partial [Acaulospora morrowiae]